MSGVGDAKTVRNALMKGSQFFSNLQTLPEIKKDAGLPQGYRAIGRFFESLPLWSQSFFNDFVDRGERNHHPTTNSNGRDFAAPDPSPNRGWA
jgi:hypothetical protein